MKKLNWQEKYLEGNKELIFVALNPTVEAKENEAVFCKNVTFWNILKNAGYNIEIINNKGSYPYKSMAANVFNSKTPYGFVDIVEDCYEKKSSKVSINDKHFSDLIEKIQKTNCKKIILLGHKVAEFFVKRYRKELGGKWDELKNDKSVIKKNDGKGIMRLYRNYGELGVISLYNNETKVYVVPFPETSPIKEKSKYYKI